MHKHIPNVVTVMRMALVLPVMVLFCFASCSPNIHLILVILVVLACISDKLDGYLARRWNCVSEFGAQCDPLADKLVVLWYLPLVKMNLIHFIPVVVLLIRDIWSAHLRSLTPGQVVGAKFSGKIKTAVNLVFLCLLVGIWPVKGSYFFWLWPLSGFLYWTSAIVISTVCVWSGIDYWYKLRK
ncbi:MAG: CDP-diacylglycerol--glycerol-3-phosphate 3-phosphatidyltransferase [bacterium]